MVTKNGFLQRWHTARVYSTFEKLGVRKKEINTKNIQLQIKAVLLNVLFIKES